MYEIRNREEKGRLVSEENSIERERMKRGRCGHRVIDWGTPLCVQSQSLKTYPWGLKATTTSSPGDGWTSCEDDASSPAYPRAPSRFFEARSKPGRFCVCDPSGCVSAEPRLAGASFERCRPAHATIDVPRQSALEKRVALARCDADPQATTTTISPAPPSNNLKM